VHPAQFFAASRLVIVAGKGGVGKTTVSAALARAAALAGLSTLVVEVEGRSGLATMFGQTELGYDEIVLSAGGTPNGAADVRARTLTSDTALLEYLRDHGMSRLSKRLVASGALELVAAAAPGIKDILVLGKVKQLERSGVADLIVLDAPAAGHAITFLTSASGLLDAVRVGPINAQARDVLELLQDHQRCQVMLVTIPEETPVNEAVETAFSLEDRVGVGLGPVVVNGVYPEIDGLGIDPEAAAAQIDASLRPGEAAALDEALRFRQRRMDLQREQLGRLEERLPLPQLRIPFLFTGSIGPAEVDRLAGVLLDEIALLTKLPT
jgi:anion-transporting  ArsA/GET3 family ATPase